MSSAALVFSIHLLMVPRAVDDAYDSRINLAVLYGLLSNMVLGSDRILLCQHYRGPPLLTIDNRSVVHLFASRRWLSSDISLVTANLSHPLNPKHAMCCDDFCVNNCIETCCKTHEERRDTILRRLLDGICTSRPGVPPTAA